MPKKNPVGRAERGLILLLLYHLDQRRCLVSDHDKVRNLRHSLSGSRFLFAFGSTTARTFGEIALNQMHRFSA